MATDAIFGRQMLHIDDHGDEVPQTSLMEHGAFRLSCGTAGVNHVGEAVRLRQVDGGVRRRAFGSGALSHEVVNEKGLG